MSPDKLEYVLRLCCVSAGGRVEHGQPDVDHACAPPPRLSYSAVSAALTQRHAAVNYDLQQAIPSLDSISGPGSFALLDNLALGLPPNVPHAGDPGLTVTESSTHFAIWCKECCPLICSVMREADHEGS